MNETVIIFIFPVTRSDEVLLYSDSNDYIISGKMCKEL
jgi:hypothetical protein